MLPKPSAEEQARFLEYAMKGDGPQTTLFELLVSDGACLPRPDELNDSEVSAKLWEVIDALWNHGAALYNTDHLSDRELYCKLFEGILHDRFPIVPDGFDFWTDIDLLGYDGDDTAVFLKYYADEKTRQEFARGRKITLPEHEDPPFPRAHLLPG